MSYRLELGWGPRDGKGNYKNRAIVEIARTASASYVINDCRIFSDSGQCEPYRIFDGRSRAARRIAEGELEVGKRLTIKPGFNRKGPLCTTILSITPFLRCQY